MLTTVTKPIKTPKILNRYQNKCQPLFPHEVNFVRTTSVGTTHISGRFQYTANGSNASNDQIYVGQTDCLILLWCIGKGKKLYATYTQKNIQNPCYPNRGRGHQYRSMRNELLSKSTCELIYDSHY